MICLEIYIIIGLVQYHAANYLFFGRPTNIIIEHRKQFNYYMLDDTYECQLASMKNSLRRFII